MSFSYPDFSCRCAHNLSLEKARKQKRKLPIMPNIRLAKHIAVAANFKIRFNYQVNAKFQIVWSNHTNLMILMILLLCYLQNVSI